MNCASARRRATRACAGASKSELRADAATAWSLGDVGVEDAITYALRPSRQFRRQRIHAPNVCMCAKSAVFVYFKEDNLGEGVYLDIIILTNSS